MKDNVVQFRPDRGYFREDILSIVALELAKNPTEHDDILMEEVKKKLETLSDEELHKIQEQAHATPEALNTAVKQWEAKLLLLCQSAGNHRIENIAVTVAILDKARAILNATELDDEQVLDEIDRISNKLVADARGHKLFRYLIDKVLDIKHIAEVIENASRKD